jgi:anti-sigma B factor antagonist
VSLSLSTERDAGTMIVTVAGEVDLATTGQLEGELNAAVEAAGTTVIVDLSAVTFLDSAGINTLLRSRRLAEEHGRQLRVTGAEGIVRQVLEMTGVLAHLSGASQSDQPDPAT